MKQKGGRKKGVTFFAFLASLASLAVLADFSWGAPAAPKERPKFDPSKLFMNKPAPNFTLKTFDGKQDITLGEFKGKKVVLINFFATWCQPCYEETPSFVKVYEEYREKGVEFISVDVLEKEGTDVPKALGEYVKQFGVPWPVTIDGEDHEVANLYRIGVRKVLPTNIGIDKNGVVRFYQLGKVEEVWLREQLDFMITGKKPEPTTAPQSIPKPDEVTPTKEVKKEP